MAMTLKLETLEDVRDWHAHLAAIGDMGTGAIIEAIADNNRKATKIIDAHLSAQAKVRVTDGEGGPPIIVPAWAWMRIGSFMEAARQFRAHADSYVQAIDEGADAGEDEPSLVFDVSLKRADEAYAAARLSQGDLVHMPSGFGQGSDSKLGQDDHAKPEDGAVFMSHGAQGKSHDDDEWGAGNCNVCGRPILYGERHSTCGTAIMEAEKKVRAERTAVPNGWVMVPRIPSLPMILAVHQGPNCADEELRGADIKFWSECWEAFLTAATQPPEGARVFPDEMLRSAYRRGFLSACDWPEPCYQDTNSEAYRVEREKALKVLLAAPTLAGKEG